MGDPPAVPVAVIGMARPLPRILESPDELWEALLRGDDLVSEIPRTGGTLTSTTTPKLAFPLGRYRGGPGSWTTLPASIVSSSEWANVAQA